LLFPCPGLVTCVSFPESLESGMGIEPVIAVNQRADPELVLEIIDEVPPRSFDLCHFPVQLAVTRFKLLILRD